ncbi:MAG: nitrate reductase molybdenum cofactor assembly chaperone [bacterium]|jgi:nitrate reductase delta subunit
MGDGKETCAAAGREIGAQDRRLIYSAASLLLDYPGDEVLASLDSAAADIGSIACGRARGVLEEALRYLRSTPREHAEETYTATFDFEPSCTLGLAYHLFGDTAERAEALAALNRIYREANCEPVDSLPDHAPALLEFMSRCPDETAAKLAAVYAQAVSRLAGALRERGSIYAPLAELVAECLEEESV